MKTVILCGGKGTRLREYTESIPKPLVEIGGKPILWHIMKIYSSQGFNDFILCLGYKGELIKKYFIEYRSWKGSDFTLSFGTKKLYTKRFDRDLAKWRITFVDTGLETNTGGRIKRIQKYVKDDVFFATYGDGVANINLKELLKFHKKKRRIATITCVNPRSWFGVVDISDKGLIERFREKPLMNQWVNGGFFVFNKEIFKYIGSNDILEKGPLEKLTHKKQIAAYKFDGFWQCMDTYKDTEILNELWKQNKAPWKIWK